MNITLKNLHEATEYDVIKQVGTHLLRQGTQSLSVDGMCMYRGERGRRCAAGCLISDGEYDSAFEFQSWEGLVVVGKVPSAHEKLIYKLQCIHDTEYAKNWPECLRHLCDERGLGSNWVDEVLNEHHT